MGEAAGGLGRIVAGSRLIVCLGSGGVGKTTTAAAIGLAASEAGRRTLVLTVDPARRLADALGLERIDGRARGIPPERLREAGLPGDLPFQAMMLDARSGFEELISRITPDATLQRRILGNTVFQQLAGSIAGAQEYIAMEQLHALHTGGRYDLIVLDTPPTKNAIDFLGAPDRLADFLDENVIRWFIRPPESGRLGALLFQTGGELTFRLLGVLVGVDFARELVEFFQCFADLHHGFRQRATEVGRILRADSTAFLLVTSSEAGPLAESGLFRSRMEEGGMPVRGIVVNRAVDAFVGRFGPLHDLAALRDGIRQRLAGLRRSEFDTPPSVGRLLDRYREMLGWNLGLLANLDRLMPEGGREVPVVLVPRHDGGLDDLTGLRFINGHLFPA